MSNEKMRDDPSWQTRLDQLGQLPGTDETWKEAAWNKLHARLHVKEKEPGYPGEGKEPTKLSGEGQHGKKRVLWYWMAAAACIAFICLLGLWPFQSGRHASFIANGVGQKPPVSAGQRPVVAAIDSAKGTAVLAAEIKVLSKAPAPDSILSRSIGASAGGSTRITGRLAQRKALISEMDSESTPVKGSDIAYGQAAPPPAILVAVLPAAVKPKLRVVYINELGGRIAEEPIMGHVADSRLFPVRFPFNASSNNRLTGMETTVDSGREFSPLLKIALKN